MIDGASILITGGTGSFGQCCVKTLLRDHSPSRVIVFSRDELKQYEMKQRFDSPCMRYFIGDVRDEKRLRRAFEGVDLVIHAAALKQVPALEYNPGEAVQTNIRGAENIINAALDVGVKKVVALSTDKAALPINLYGATKFVSDKLFISGNSIRGQRDVQFSVVRYGNVVGSRGSVVPLFKRLVAEGVESLPITDPRMTRFLITLDQGVQFVLKAFQRMQGGEVFVPKLPTAKVIDIAEAIAPGMPTRVVGIRPGEKLHEVLCPRDESHQTQEFDDFYLIRPQYVFVGSPDYSRTLCGEAGVAVDDEFEYRSDTNTQFLNVEEIQSLLAADASHTV